MNILISLLFSLLLLFGQKTFDNKADERVLAYIEIVQIGNDVYVRTTYDKRIFDNECSPKHVVAKNFYKGCVDTVDTKTKKL